MQGIGEASMLWSEIPTGIFESTKACELGERRITEIEQAQKELLEKKLTVERIIATIKTWKSCQWSDKRGNGCDICGICDDGANTLAQAIIKELRQ